MMNKSKKKSRIKIKLFWNQVRMKHHTPTHRGALEAILRGKSRALSVDIKNKKENNKQLDDATQKLGKPRTNQMQAKDKK